MQIEFKGFSDNDLPLNLPFEVDGKCILITVGASPETIRSAKVLKDFRDKRIIPHKERSSTAVARDVIRDLADFLFEELEQNELKTAYYFTLKELMELNNAH